MIRRPPRLPLTDTLLPYTRLSRSAPESARRYEILALDEAGPFSEVLEKRSTLVIKGYDDWRAHASDEVVRDAMAAGLVTMVCAPLLDAAGEVAGTLAVAWSTEVEIDAPTYAIVQKIGRAHV